jgi:bifunctional non-homologous end joining protein LigD
MTLKVYRQRRDFAISPEPSGAEQGGEQEAPLEREGAQRRFVVQEHHASHLHYDFRLEMDGVLRSWAVPKGPPEEPGVRRLAVAVEDHPLSYIDFHGTIPPGQYGAGTVEIWDSGTYDLEERTPDELRIVLHGVRLQGPYALIRMQPDGKNWLLFRRQPSSP